MPIDLILYIAIAVVLVVWLRNTLGTRHGEERDRSAIVTALGSAEGVDEVLGDIKKLMDENGADRLVGIDISGDKTRTDLMDYMKHDPSFNPKAFVDGAKDAFALIVESFAKGDLQVLKELTAPVVYSAFEQAVTVRNVAGETVQTEVHAIKSCTFLGVKHIDRMVFVKLRMVADETCVVRNREGVILSGNPEKITQMNDVWTFGRDVRSKDPTWYLFETSDDVVEDHKTPLPEAGQTPDSKTV